jgi:two-component system LytT family response regulator
MRFRTLIADDEPLARRKIRALLEREPDFEVLGECGSGAETVRLIRSLGPDLVFLDVEMPELDGLSVLQTLGPRPFAVIFVTAYEQYAVRAFEVKALDYLLKPFDRRRFRTALERAREHLRSTEAPLSRLLVRAKDRSEVLKVEDIDFLEAADNYVKVHALGRTHLLRGSLARLQSRLDRSRFLRIHRSTLVNVERIRSLYPLFHGDQMIVLRDGTELSLSRRYRSEVESLLGRPSRP